MKTYYSALAAVVILAALAISQYTIVAAKTSFADIQYPVQELGNCQSESECKQYCDNKDNAETCLDVALQKGFMSAQEVDIARKFLKKEIEGPGGCTTQETCEAYCDDMSHIKECVAFAEKNNLVPPEELQEFKRVQAALERGIKPPLCTSRAKCELYCEDPLHMKECVTFGKEAGFLEGDELKEAEKMLSAIERGVKPPSCRGRESCKKYCSMPDNMESCLNFALEAGFMEGNERDEAQKMLQAIQRGVKPLSCSGREECDEYCSQEDHIEECVTFATEAGFMNEEEAEMARKTGGKGPGDCKGREQCEAFCQNPENRQACFDFAKEHGMLSQEDAQRMEEGSQQVRRGLENAPPEVMECLKKSLGEEAFEKMKNGGAPSEQLGQQIKSCFEMMRPEREGGTDNEPPHTVDGQIPERPSLPEGGAEEFKNQYNEQYRQQYEEQQKMMEEKMRQQQQEQQRFIEETQKPQSRGFRSTIIGSVLHGLLQLLLQ